MEEDVTLKLIIEKGPRAGETHEFNPRSVIKIGRVVRGNTLAFKDSGISSKHLSIEFKSGKWSISDLDSSNGTVLNDTKLQPFTPADLADDDTIKIGEYTSINVKLDFGGGENHSRRNPRGGRRGGAEAILASVSENTDLGLVNEVEVAVKYPNTRGRPRKARVLKNDEGLEFAGRIEPKQVKQVSSRVTRSSKREENQKIGESVSLDPVEEIKGRRTRANTRGNRLQGKKPAESVPMEAVREEEVVVESLEQEGIMGNLPNELVDVHVDKQVENVVEESNLGGNFEGLASTFGAKETCVNEPEENVVGQSNLGANCEGLASAKETCVNEHEENAVEESNLGENCEGLARTSGAKETCVDVDDEQEEYVVGESNLGANCEGLANTSGAKETFTEQEESVVEKSNLGANCEGLASTSSAKETCVNVEDEPDLEKMTLGEWFDYLEIQLPKQIYEATEEIILGMTRTSEQFHEFVSQQKEEKEKGKLPAG